MLGGVGADSHSIGMTILRQALWANGFRILYLGTQNHLEEFFRRAHTCNVVMISNLDGHAKQYLQEFPDLMRQYSTEEPLWYLGGNLTIGDALGYERHFLEMGFDRVLVKFVDVNVVLSLLERDLNGVEPVEGSSSLRDESPVASRILSVPVSDDPLELDTFEGLRSEVLGGWKTGHQSSSIEANAEFLSSQPSFSKAQALVASGRMPALVQPRCGVALVSEQVKQFKAFKSLGARVLSYQVDSLTRVGDYVAVEEAVRESRAIGRSTINGFPVINYGVPVLRQVISEVGVPLQVRHSTRDPRLLAEISYAGGVTAIEGGPISYNLPYYKDYPLSESISTWQYLDRLTGLYYERFGITLDRELFGTLTGTLIPPSIAIVVNLLEAILAVQQGVKSLSLAYAEQGNRIQDIAAIRVLGSMVTEIITNLGFTNVQIATVFHQYMAAFPDKPRLAEDLIYQSAITAGLSGASRVIAKTPVEAYKIPTMADNMHGLSLVMRGLSSAGEEHVDEVRVAEECAIIRREAQAIFDSLLLCGRGSITEGVITGFREGYIDIPFAPSIYNKGEVMTARDNEGAVRFLSVGNLQFDGELREFHDHKMQERRRSKGLMSKREDYMLVEQDVLMIARGQYDRWPLSG